MITFFNSQNSPAPHDPQQKKRPALMGIKTSRVLGSLLTREGLIRHWGNYQSLTALNFLKPARFAQVFHSLRIRVVSVTLSMPRPTPSICSS